MPRQDSRWSGAHVEVTWRLLDISSNVTFDVSRRESPPGPGRHQAIADPEIARNGNEFIFRDRSAEPGRTYDYRVVIREDGEIVTLFETTVSVPSAPFALAQNYPNPFNPSTQIRFSVDRNDLVELTIYDVSGRMVRRLVNRPLAAGAYIEPWNGRDSNGKAVASGIYFYRLTAGKKSLTRKAILLR